MHDVFFFTDIHGMYIMYKTIMDYCSKQDPEATIIFGGDACDRGLDGYRIMKELLANPKVVYLKGNHEDMFYKAAREIKEKLKFNESLIRKEVRETIYWSSRYDYKYSYIKDSLYNGGIETLTDWVMDGMPMGIIEALEHLPLTFSTETLDFCHSGTLYKTFKSVADAEYKGEIPDAYDADALIWGRTGLHWGWAPNRTVVFGHTPTPYLKDYIHIKLDKEKIYPVKYLGDENTTIADGEMTGTKIDMDTGACATGRFFVLNCLTMKAQGFEFDEKMQMIKEIECIQM